MKTRILLTFLAGISTQISTAQILALESFTGRSLGAGIAPSPISGTGWLNDWIGTGVSDARFQIIDPTPDLSYQVSGGGLISGGNRAIQLSTAPEPVPAALLAQRIFPLQNTTIYFSFLIRVPASGTGTDSIEVRMQNGTTVTLTIKLSPLNPAPPVGRIYFLDAGGGFSYLLSGDAMTTHLIVFKYGPSSGGEYWLDPAYSAYNSPKGKTGGSFDRISLSSSSTDSAGPTTTVILDEFRVGYTWPDVVPAVTPPPTVAALAIEQASRIRWQSETGKNYQLQYSYDMNTWFDFGSTISGNGQMLDAYDSITSDPKKFYRAQIR